MRAIIGALSLGIMVGLIGWFQQTYLKEMWLFVTEVRPYLLTAEAERALKPGGVFQECAGDCPEMVVVPTGSFMMGSPKGPGEGSTHNEQPQHEVTITKPFAAGKYEVTFAEWDACVAAEGCPAASDNGWGRGTRPVINVSWDDAQRYVTWLSRLTGKTYRLLTEAEWEYAARAGTTTAYSFGDDEAALGEYAWYNENSDLKTHPVGEKKPNAFGLYDMYGNVLEMVEDIYHDNYNGAPTDGSAWLSGGDPTRRVRRGGSWGYGPPSVRSALRDWSPPNGRLTVVGFRVSRTLTP